MPILLAVAITGAFIQIVRYSILSIQPVRRLLMIMTMVVLVATQVWIISARLGQIGDPATLNKDQHYRLAAMTGTQDVIVILANDQGRLNSYRFKGPIRLDVGSLYTVQKQADIGYTLVKEQ